MRKEKAREKQFLVTSICGRGGNLTKLGEMLITLLGRLPSILSVHLQLILDEFDFVMDRCVVLFFIFIFLSTTILRSMLSSIHHGMRTSTLAKLADNNI